MSTTRATATAASAQSAAAPLVTPKLLRVFVAQMAFGFGWSVFLILPKYLATQLNARDAVIGSVTSMSGFAAVGTIPLVAWGIDRWGRLLFLRAGSTLLALVAAGYLFVDTVGPLIYALSAATGASFVLAFNATMTLATDDVPPQKMGQAIGLLGASNMSMNAVATATGEHLAMAAGWPTVFACAGVAALLALAWSTQLEDRRASPDASDDSDVQAGQLRRVAPLFVVALLVGAAFAAMFTFHQPYALKLGAERVSEFFVGFTGTAVLIRLTLGSLGDRFGRLRISLCALALYASVVVATRWLQVELLWVYGAALGAAHGVLYPTLNALAVERVSDAARGRAITAYNGAFNGGVAVSALVWGQVAEHWGYPTLFLAAGLVGYVAFACLGWPSLVGSARRAA